MFTGLTVARIRSCQKISFLEELFTFFSYCLLTEHPYQVILGLRRSCGNYVVPHRVRVGEVSMVHTYHT